MTPLAQWAVKNYTPEVRNVGFIRNQQNKKENLNEPVFYGTRDPGDAPVGPSPQSALPNTDHLPTLNSQQPRDPPVLSAVVFDLLPPKGRIGVRHLECTRIAMPKIAVHEDNHTLGVKSEVGTPRKGHVAAPPEHASGPKSSDKAQFGRAVAAGLYASHNLRAFRGRKNICHTCDYEQASCGSLSNSSPRAADGSQNWRPAPAPEAGLSRCPESSGFRFSSTAAPLRFLFCPGRDTKKRLRGIQV